MESGSEILFWFGELGGVDRLGALPLGESAVPSSQIEKAEVVVHLIGADLDPPPGCVRKGPSGLIASPTDPLDAPPVGLGMEGVRHCLGGPACHQETGVGD